MPGILEVYTESRTERRLRLAFIALEIFLWAVALAGVAVLIFFSAAGCRDPCNTHREHPDTHKAREAEDGRASLDQGYAGGLVPPQSGPPCRSSAAASFSLPAAPTPSHLQHLLAAIRQVESGGRADLPDGDGGRAIGAYQVHVAYWTDARLPGRYEDCRKEDYARTVVLAYWTRYAPGALAALDRGTRPLEAAAVLARIHNGGPQGHRRTSTLGYWQRVLAALETKAANDAESGGPVPPGLENLYRRAGADPTAPAAADCLRGEGAGHGRGRK